MSLTQEEKAAIWQEGRSATGIYLGHHPDCAGWDDCFCEQFINPYAPPKELTGWCYMENNHPPHPVPEERDTPAYTCEGRYKCSECFWGWTFGEYPENHVCAHTPWVRHADPDVVTCVRCGEVFHSAFAFTEHHPYAVELTPQRFTQMIEATRKGVSTYGNGN